MKTQATFSSENAVCGRQIAFFAAFVLPVYKMLETPSLLAEKMQGDLLLPAILQFLCQGAILVLLLFFLSKSEKSLFERMENRLGKWSNLIYLLLAFFFLFSSILPLLDGEKFVYVAFFDTAPTSFTFAFFFILLGFACVKGIKTVGRIADLCLFLFLIPFLILLFFSIFEADASNLLPFFESNLDATMSAFKLISPHFSDCILLLPLLGNLKYKKHDSLKISIGYSLGALFNLLFLFIFYGVFSTASFKEHYAFLKIAQYFPALTLVGRVDLIFIYALSIVFFFYLCTPLQYFVLFFCQSFRLKNKPLVSSILSVGLLFFVLYANTRYNFFYRLFCEKLFFVFWIFSLLPLLCFLLNIRTKTTLKKEEEQ